MKLLTPRPGLVSSHSFGASAQGYLRGGYPNHRLHGLELHGWLRVDQLRWTSWVNFTDETGDIDEYTALPTQLTRIQRSAGAWYPNVATTGCFEQEEEDEQYLV
ncbi:hypothetical protein GN244_ATG06330 [Phytophthora infestans]|uniref:Uncharacterized protein n=1 Tax=Phytophthora infestans TaxID=4787 RepID=A0A833SXT4_PHYIN|nr:hypothetical protein GN244_ATG06330 [Phytophthora infestans]